MERVSDENNGKYTAIISSFGLRQHVTSSTHNRGGLLDVIVTGDANPPSDIAIIETGVSDHELLYWYALITLTDLEYRKLSKRIWKNFNIYKFLDDIRNSDLCCGDIGEPSQIELNLRVACFDSVISGLLDKHALRRNFTYWWSKISSSGSDSRRVWRTVNSLLGEKKNDIAACILS